MRVLEAFSWSMSHKNPQTDLWSKSPWSNLTKTGSEMFDPWVINWSRSQGASVDGELFFLHLWSFAQMNLRLWKHTIFTFQKIVMITKMALSHTVVLTMCTLEHFPPPAWLATRALLDGRFCLPQSACVYCLRSCFLALSGDDQGSIESET